MCGKVVSSDGYKIIKDKLEIRFKEHTNYFKASVKGVIKAVVNDDENNIIILENNEELEIKDSSISKIEFFRDVENCIFAKVKYYADVKTWN